jgi:ketosteroid isomerase-like protein
MVEHRAVVEAYFAAVNERRFAALAQLFAPDAELRAVGTAPRRGRGAIAAYYPEVLSGFASGTDTPTRMIQGDDTVVVEITFVGRTVDDIDVTFDAIDVFDLGHDGIERLSIWYDTRRLVRQLDEARADRGQRPPPRNTV